MRSFIQTLSTAVLAMAFLAGCDAVGVDQTSSFADAHESNNRAELTGMQDGTALSGTAIVNYAKGSPTEWQSTVNVKGDLDNGTYSFFVAGGPSGAAGTLVCTFTVDGSGRQGCSADTPLEVGFARAEIREEDGTVIATGVFARRGGNRVR